MSLKVRWILLFLLVGILAACQKQETIGISAEMNGIPYHIVSVTELQSMLENKDFTMVNVHTPWEGDIPQTDLQLAFDQLETNIDQLPAEKDAKIVIYCYTSGMAKQAVATLTGQGFTNIWMLDGGTSAWEEAGLSLDQ